MASEDVESLQDLQGGGMQRFKQLAKGWAMFLAFVRLPGACKLPGKPVACNHGLLLMLWFTNLGYSSTVAYLFSYLALEVSLKLVKRARSWKSLARHPSPRVRSSASCLALRGE